MTIKISGMITNDDDAPIYRDWLGMDVVSPKDVTDNLPDDGSDVDVEINSYGGEVDPAAEIYTALRSYKATSPPKLPVRPIQRRQSSLWLGMWCKSRPQLS
ncbi:hypothetical protein [Lacticaseibacillus pantheris]|uniref:hypothetical protein n=1 Tax=Lacticaseibacillus pantheris TaxID=171523 RepID=UPI000AB5674A|nr:hypothetical protein [Lacticaseibacillus pantheris]